jgi:hypothetical protein
MLNIVTLNVVMLSVVMLSVVKLSVVKLSVVARRPNKLFHCGVSILAGKEKKIKQTDASLNSKTL